MKQEFRTSAEWYPLAASYDGRIMNLETGVIRSHCVGNHGYPIVSYRKTLLVHRIVASIFLPNPNKLPCVNHKDLDKTNNNVSNLEWCTYKENAQHAAINGSMNHLNHLRGEECNLTIYSDLMVHAICRDIQQGMRNIDIGKKYNVSNHYAKELKSGGLRSDITSQYTLNKHNNKSVSVETVMWICQKIVDGCTANEIIESSNNPNVKVNLIKNIRRKGSYSNISDNYF